MKHKLYETYGFGTNPDPSKIVTDLTPDYGINKPTKAWWGSPVDGNYTWEKWCLDNDFHTGRIRPNNRCVWTLENKAKILYINSLHSLIKCVEKGLVLSCHGFDTYVTAELTKADEWNYKCFDFQKIKDAGYTAIQLTDAYLGHYWYFEHTKLEWMMNSWDCESIVVLDPSKIRWCE